MKTRQETKAEELRKWLQDKRLILDCHHRHCQHNFSNTMVITPEGRIICSECYQ